MEINVGKGLSIDVDTAKLPANVMDHVVYIGLRNILMDSHAGISTDETDYQDKSRATVEKKLAAMYAGEVRVAGTREGDPVRAEAMRLALAQVDALLRKAGKKPSKVEAKDKRAAAQKLITDELLATAKARVEQQRSIGGEVELADLGL